MTNSANQSESAVFPRLIARHYRVGKSARHITCLFRPSGHHWLPARDFTLRPRPLPELASLWGATERRVFGLTTILSGSARLRLGREARRVVAGCVIVFSDVPSSRIAYDQESADFQEASLSVDPDTGAALAGLCLWPDCERTRRVAPELARAEFEQMFHLLELKNPSPGELLRRATMLLARLGGDDASGPDRLPDGFAARACAALRERCGPADRIADIAAALGCAPRTFRRRFIRATGLSPTDFQLRERMSRATALLARRGVRETAEALGYDSPFVFSRQFKQCFGTPPVTYAAATSFDPTTVSKTKPMGGQAGRIR